MLFDDESFWTRLRQRLPLSRAWLARGGGLAVTIALLVGFAALILRDRAPFALTPSAQIRATIAAVKTLPPDTATTPALDPTYTLSSNATPVPFACANAPGSQRTYAYVDHDRQIYRVTGCANPVRLTNYDEKSFARPLAFSPTNRWLMISVQQNISDTSYPDCQVLLNPTNGAVTRTPFCGDSGNEAWIEWPEFIAWLDDNTFLESLTHKDGTVSVASVNAATFARSPVAT